jgi:hypothetical protein
MLEAEAPKVPEADAEAEAVRVETKVEALKILVLPHHCF